MGTVQGKRVTLLCGRGPPKQHFWNVRTGHRLFLVSPQPPYQGPSFAAGMLWVGQLLWWWLHTYRLYAAESNYIDLALKEEKEEFLVSSIAKEQA